MKTREILIDTNALLDGWEIREATQRDAFRIVDYLHQIANEPAQSTRFRPGSVPSLLEMIDQLRWYGEQATSKVFIANKGGALIGVLFVLGNDSPFTRHTVELSVNVHAEYRGQGVGSRLMNLAMEWIRNQGTIRRVELHVLTRNEGAARLYERLGFRVEGCLHQAYLMADEGDDVFVDALIMAAHLN